MKIATSFQYVFYTARLIKVCDSAVFHLEPLGGLVARVLVGDRQCSGAMEQG